MSQRLDPSDSFVPFTALAVESAQPPPAANIQALPRHETSAPFTPLEARAPSAAPPGADGPKHGKPVVTLQREGDQVTGIRIECGCGQIIELACSYGSNPLAP